MEHLAEQSVLDLVTGALVEPAATAAHAHLDTCAECRDLVAVMLRADATLPALGAGSPDPASMTVAEMPRARRAPRPPPVTRIAEYELLEVLGRGGMGTVYRARDTLLDRDVAIKLIARTSTDAARQRFLVEARAVARIRHPNVVVVHRVAIADDQPYIIYELVRGRTFRELRKPMPWPRVLELAVGIVRGLSAAHACNVLHRDIKPTNVMLDERDEIVLVDFGLAKLDADDSPIAAMATEPTHVGPITMSGVALGTPRYMAPEAWRGASATPQTDLYSFGVVLYELLAGRAPFQDTPVDELARCVCNEDPPSVSTYAPWVPVPFAQLVDRCIARDPAHRPVAAAGLGEELEAMQRGRAFETFERERARRAPQGNPYPGARPFELQDQGVFFGRRDELRTIVDQLRTRPFVVVAGESGVGKTSLCVAGLLPLLARCVLGGPRKWVPVPMRPGRAPLAALAEALAGHSELPREEINRLLVDDPDRIVAGFRAGHGLGCSAHVLFIDALEELVTIADPDQARRFASILGKLAEPASAVRVVATLDARSMLAVAQLPGLASVIGPAIYLLLEPRDPAVLREIVVEPAQLVGKTLAPPVVDSLVTAGARGELRIAELQARLAQLFAEPG